VKLAIVAAVMAATILITGCGKNTHPSLKAWQKGDKAAAVSSFVAADWNAHPLFPAGSVLSLSEAQFRALSDADRNAKRAELLTQLETFRDLSSAVLQAGRDAASKGDVAQARKCFASLKQCGTALNSPDYMDALQHIGQAIVKMPDKDLAQIGQ
jgi:hypothetical protein